MWGMGDGTAALVGVPFGKHKVNLKGTDDKKSLEGSISMLLVSFLFDILSLIICSSMPLLHMTIVVMIGHSWVLLLSYLHLVNMTQLLYQL